MATQSKTKRSSSVRKQRDTRHEKAKRPSHKNDNKKPSTRFGTASTGSVLEPASWEK